MRNLIDLSISGFELQNNNIIELPSEIGQLETLGYLDLSNNELTNLPLEIRHMPKLGKLDLSGNPLVDPPPDIVEQGSISAIFAYLDEKAATQAEHQRIFMMIGVSAGVAFGVTLLYRQVRYGGRQKKKKRMAA